MSPKESQKLFDTLVGELVESTGSRFEIRTPNRFETRQGVLYERAFPMGTAAPMSLERPRSGSGRITAQGKPQAD